MKLRFEKIDRFFVFCYKLIGIAVLTLVGSAVVFYAFLFVFYTFNTNWAIPVRLSPSQQPVLTFQAQIVTLKSELDTRRIELEAAEQTETELTLASQKMKDVLKRTEKAFNSETKLMSNTSNELKRAITDKGWGGKNGKQDLSIIDALRSTTKQDLESALITKEEAANRAILLQNASVANIQQNDMIARLRNGVDTFQGGESSLSAISSIARVSQQYLALAQMKIQLKTAKSQVAALKEQTAESERVLKAAKSSPYYLASQNGVTVLFVPYENLGHVQSGSPVYDCYFRILGCYQVGEVKQVLEAEEFGRHPFFRTDAKGQFVSVEISHDAAESLQLFIGRRPLLL